MALFGVDLASILAEQLGPNLLEGRLQRVTTGLRTPGNLTGGLSRSYSSFTFRGVRIDYSSFDRANTSLIKIGDVRCMVLLGSINTVPQEGDIVTIDDFVGTVKRIEGRDPASATMNLHLTPTTAVVSEEDVEEGTYALDFTSALNSMYIGQVI